MNSYKLCQRTVLFFTYVVLMTSGVFAQSFDYESKPVFDYTFVDARIDLKVDPANASLVGSVEYQLQANISGADTLSLDAVGMTISEVSTNGESLSYTNQNDHLDILLTDASEAGQQYQVKIAYSTTPHFGVLKSCEGTVWTSMLPLSTRHWLPVRDNPRVEMPITLSLQVPADYTAFASGVKTDEETLADGSQKSTFRSGIPIAVTSLAFGLGKFREKATSYGIKRMVSYAEPNAADIAAQQQIVQKAKDIIESIEQNSGTEYPFQQLHIAILNDHYWEEKSYGSSTIFLYKNRGDFMHQLRRGLYAQWFGVYQREAQWSDAQPIHILQTALHYGMMDEPAPLKKRDEPETNFSTVYDNFNVENWNFWQQYSTWNVPNTKNIAAKLISKLLQKGAGTITSATFNDAWYQLSGQPVINIPSFTPDASKTEGNATDDTLRYRVDYEPISGTNSLQMIFKAQEGSITEPVTLPLKITVAGGSNNAEATFSGATDSISVDIPAGTQNVQIIKPKEQEIIFEVHKPVSYVLYQLRNAETTEARRQAAIQIGYHADEPDLQLALNDFIDQPMEPEVKAALLRSYGAITHGASGTQKRFMEALQNENPQIRAAALAVLNNYDDKTITQKLKTYSETETDEALSNQALKLYMQRIDSTAAIAFTNTLVQQDTSGTKAIVAIANLAETGSTKKAVKLANFYIEPVFSYSIRKQAFEILLHSDTSAAAWKERLPVLLNDSDSRVRFITFKHLKEIPGVDSAAILQKYKPQEYDARVKKVMSLE